jgi:tetratricopeptide (TPR) repeat protein/transcriptional regulator with XRE-family HTH domain
VFGDLTRTHRQRLRMTQDELAAKSGVGVRSIRAIEAGRIRNPRLTTVRLLADALGLAGAERDRFCDAAEPEAAAAASATGTDRPVPAQLPADVAGFAGRADHLSQLQGLLRDPEGPASSTVVISAIAGTGGVGKTALAVHWGHRVKAWFPDGQLYVNLRGFGPGDSVVSPSTAVRVLLDALDVPAENVPTRFEAQVGLYRSLLSGRRMLVILDNARDADQVRPLLPGAEGCLVVVTSRHDLADLVAKEGARPIRLDVLTTEEARDLLANRLGDDRVAADPAAVDEIIDRCGHLPLALAVVAARAAAGPTVALSTVAQQLRRPGLHALASDDPASDIRTVFGWSYRALSPAAARMFRLLGLHAGPDIAWPAAASLAAEASTLARTALAELASAHLATEHQPGRYTMHDLVRAYAGELARAADPEDERRRAVGRSIDHYRLTARAGVLLLNPAQELVDLGAVEPGVVPEHLADYDEAMAWFTAEHAVLLATVHLAAGSDMPTHAWQLAGALPTYLSRRGRWQDYVAIQNLALDCARRAGDRAGQAQVLRNLGSAYYKTERYELALRHLEEALDIAVAVGDQVVEANVHIGLSMVKEVLGRPREALEHDLRSLALSRATGDRHGLARALNSVGWDYAVLGEHERAVGYCEEALAVFIEAGNRLGQAATLNSLGNCHHHLGDNARAVERYRLALAIFREMGDRYYEADTLFDLMGPLQGIGDVDAARAAGEEALVIFEQLGHSRVDEVRAQLERLPPDEPGQSPGRASHS